jgi:hypothetical protein
MATTTNFGWTTPDDSALVQQGAAAIRSLGTSIDTSLLDLKGGTTGQTLTKATNADMDFAWTTATSGGMTLLSTTALTGTSTTVSGISQSYTNLMIQVLGPMSSPSEPLMFRFNGITSADYRASQINVGGSVSWNTATSQTRMNMNFYTELVANKSLAEITVPNYSTTGQIKRFFFSNMSDQYNQFQTGYFQVQNLSAAITSVNVQTSEAQTFTGGNILIYGENL